MQQAELNVDGQAASVPSVEVNQKQLAEIFQCTDRNVRKLEDQEVIRSRAKGRYDLSACVSAYVVHLRMSAKGGGGTSPHARESAKWDARYKRSKALAMEHALTPVKSVRALLRGLVQMFLGRIDALPDRLCRQLAAEEDYLAIRELLADEIISIRADLERSMSEACNAVESGRLADSEADDDEDDIEMG